MKHMRSMTMAALPCAALLASAGAAAAVPDAMFGAVQAPAGASLSAVDDSTPVQHQLRSLRDGQVR